MSNWQENRKVVESYFEEQYNQELSIKETPWVTGAVGIVLLKKVISGKIDVGLKVLEIGCGVGTESVYLSRQGMDVTAVDFNENALNKAKHLAKFYSTDVDFIHEDFLEIDIESISKNFDLVIDKNCFHHIPVSDRTKYASNVFNILKKNGLFFLRGFSNDIPPSKTGDGPFRLTSDDLINTFKPFFIINEMYKFKNIPLPDESKEQIFWSFLGKKRDKKVE